MYDVSMASIRTLVIDDSPEFIRIARRFLERNPQVELVGWAADGDEAITLAQEKKPHLILMDLILPDINGVEVTRKIKTLLPQTVIVVLTLDDLEAYRSEVLLAGADALFNKSEMSDAWVSSLMEKTIVKLKKNALLIVDDSATMRRMVIASLKPLGADFGEASTGLEAIEQLALRDYDAMTLDMNMPDMHGLEVLQFLRNSERYQNLPIMVLTTRGDENSRKNALAAGANSYITKPFSPDDLLKAVKALLPP